MDRLLVGAGRVLRLAALAMSLTGCALLKDPNEPLRKPYEGLEAHLGRSRSTTQLPPAMRGEVHLGRVLQPNGKYVNEDGTFENKIGSGGQCLYAFKIDPRTGRMVSWRFASKDDPAKCHARP